MPASTQADKAMEQRSGFVGRVQEQRQFLVALQGLLAHHRRWAELAANLGPAFDPGQAPGDDSYANIFLLHGIGGIGKSWLTRRCLTLAEGIPLEPPILTLYDDVSLGPPVLEPGHLLDRLADKLARLSSDSHLADYRDARAATPRIVDRVTRYQFENRERWDKLVDMAAELVARRQPESGYHSFAEISLAHTHASGAETAGKDAPTLAKAYDLLLDQMQAAGKLTALEAALFRNPPAAQAAKLVEALQRAVADRPLVIGLDNLEIIVPLEPLIRDCLVLPTNQSPIIWILSGRYNLADEREVELNNETRIYKGYRDLLGENPPLVWDMSIFGDADLRDYLEAESDRRRMPLLIDDDLVEAIKATSSGVPLVVEMVTDALFTMDREEFLRDFALEDRSLLPDDRLGAIAERFLRYCLTQPEDMDRVQAMALLRKGADKDALAAIWRLPPHQSAWDVLRTLRTRYAFVMPEGLHDAVYDFVRRQLRTTWQASEARERLSRRAIDFYQARWDRLQASFEDSTLRVRDPQWQRATRDLLNALLWNNPDQAVLFLLPRFVEGLGFDRAFSSGLLLQAEEFIADSVSTFSGSYAALLHRMRVGLQNIDWAFEEPGEAIGAMLGSLLEAPGLAPLHLSILYLWQGNWLVEEGRLDEGLASYQQADDQLPDETSGLRRQLGKAFYEISSRFLWPDTAAETTPSEAGLQAAGRAIELDPDNDGAWFNYGVALDYLERLEEAAAAYEQAIRLEARPNYYNNLGDVYNALDRVDEAVEAYRQALVLEPTYAWPYHNLGLIYADRGDFEAALKSYQQAIEYHQRDKDRAVSWDNFGDAHAALGSYDEAISAYRWAGVLHPQLASPWYGLGNVYAALERNSEAIEAYQKAITLDPAHAWARHQLGRVYARQQDYLTAIPYLHQAIERHRDDRARGSGWNDLGDIYALLERHHDAIEAYRQAIKLDPQQADAWNSLGDLYVSLENNEEAIKAYRQAVTIEPDYAAPWNSLGNIYGTLGRDEEATEAYRRVIRLEPDYAWPYNNLGYIYSRRRDYQTAGDYFKQAIERHETGADRAISLGNLGDALVALGDDEAAIEAYQQAIDQDPDYAWPQHNLARIYERQGQVAQAIAYYRQAIERHAVDEGRARSWFNLAQVQQRLGQHEEAIKAYRQVIGLEPEEAVAWNNLGDSYRALGRTAEAAEAFRQAIELDPALAAPYRSLGLISRETGNQLNAMSFFKRAIEREPDHGLRALSWNDLGETHLFLNDPDDAVAAFQEAIRLRPNLAQPYHNLAAIAEQRQEYETALGFYQRAIEFYPDDSAWDADKARAWNGLGNVYRALERPEDAIAAYRRATTLDEQLAAPWRSLGDLFRQLAQNDEAVDSYEQSLALDPEPAGPYHALGLIHEEQGDFEAAIERFLAALDRHPEQATLAQAQSWHHLGNAYRELDQYEAAENAYQNAIRRDPDYFEPQVSLADLYGRLDQPEAAIEAYERALELNATAAGPWNNLGDVYRSLERYDEATTAYEQAIALDPAAPQPYYSLGWVNERQENYGPAVGYYEQAISRFAPEETPQQARAWNGLGNIYWVQEQNEQALAAYEQAVALDPTFAAAYHRLGSIYSALNRAELAIRYYQQALAHYPAESAFEDRAICWNNLGEAYSALKRWNRAAEAFKEAIDLDIEYALPWHNLGNVYSATGRFDEAIKAYAHAIELNPKQAWSYNNLALIYVDQKKYAEAATLFQQAIDHHLSQTDQAVSWHNLGDVYQAQKEYDQAVAAQQKAIRLDPAFARPWKSLGDVYQLQRRKEGVVEAYQQAIALDPDYAWPYHNLALIYHNRGVYPQAITFYRQALERHEGDTDRAASWNGLGNVYLAMRRYEQAAEAYRKAIQLNPADAWPYHNLAFVQKQVGQYQQAIGLYQQAIERFDSAKSKAVSWNNLGNVYSVLERNQEAIKAYQTATTLNDVYALPWNSLGEIYSRLEQTEQALQAFQQAIRLNAQYVLAWNNLGDAYWRLDKPDEAIKAYERAIALDERYAWPYHNLGLLYDERGDYESAIKYYQEAITRHTSPEQKAVLADKMGDLYRIMGETEQAIDAYRQSTGFDPLYASPWYNLGNVYAGLEQDEEAITAYRRAIELKNDDPWPYHNLALVYEKREVYGEAIALYRQAIERHRTDRERAISWDSLGNAYEQVNQLDQAVHAFRQAIALNPKYALPWNSLGDIYHQLADREQAAEAYRRSIALDPDYVWAYNSLGAVYVSLGDYDQAIDIYRRIIDRRGDSQELAASWYSLGDIYETLRREDDAIRAYEKAIQLDPDYTWPYNQLGAIYERRGDSDRAYALYQQATRRHRQRTLTL